VGGGIHQQKTARRCELEDGLEEIEEGRQRDRRTRTYPILRKSCITNSSGCFGATVRGVCAEHYERKDVSQSRYGGKETDEKRLEMRRT
jgi:hypothetical protein